MNLIYNKDFVPTFSRPVFYVTNDFLTSSTPVWDAASSSKTSSNLSSKISLQLTHSLQGSETGLSKDEQFNPIASILAIVVFPTPLIPVNKKAWAIFPLLKHFQLS